MQYNRVIAFTDSWVHTIIIALIAGLLVVFLLVFLQPFDTYTSKIDHKTLKLAGYSLSVVLPLLLIHPLERAWYRWKKKRWQLANEIVVLAVLMMGFSLLAYTYHAFVFAEGGLSLFGAWRFFINLALPFAPILLPLVIYLRYRLGKIVLVNEQQESSKIQIQGFNQDDELTLLPAQFVYAKAQQNYVEVHFLVEEGLLQKKMIRSTMGNLLEQVPYATQVHRSYLINLDYLKEVAGNSRKRILYLEHLKEAIPISNKYYQALKTHLQTRP